MQADPYETMETTVQQTIQTLTVLFKKLNEEYDDVAQVALKVRGNLEEFRERVNEIIIAMALRSPEGRAALIARVREAS